MDAETLLKITPEFLAKAIMHKHERLIEELPPIIAARQNELDTSEPLAKQARKQRDEINVKVAKLKAERNDCTAKAKVQRLLANDLRATLESEGKLKNPDPKWAREKLNDDIINLENELQTQAGDHKSEQKVLRKIRNLQAEHGVWVASRVANNPEMKDFADASESMKRLYDQADKAHQAMLELVEENEQQHEFYSMHEEARRGANSQLQRTEAALKTSTIAINNWQGRLESGFDNLLKDAEQVKSGGDSTIAIRRKAKLAAEAAVEVQEEE
jgi:uncharacterized coiled-coil DUF342 family protein